MVSYGLEDVLYGFIGLINAVICFLMIWVWIRVYLRLRKRKLEPREILLRNLALLKMFGGVLSFPLWIYIIISDFLNPINFAAFGLGRILQRPVFTVIVTGSVLMGILESIHTNKEDLQNAIRDSNTSTRNHSDSSSKSGG